MSKHGRPVLGPLLATVAVFLSACSATSATPTGSRTEPPDDPSSAASTPSTSAERPLPASTTFGDIPGAVPDPAPHAATDGNVLRVKQDLSLHETPGGESFARLPATQLHNPTWVPVIAERGEWFQVLLPSRPNHSTGWLRIRGPEQGAKARTPYLVAVDVDARRLAVLKHGRELGSWTVGVGGPGTPTPRGRTFLMASIEETVTGFSPVILPLGTHSETLNSYGGGPGTVALHGWPDPAVFGHASSDGCVRVPADALELLTSLPLGTLVLLR